MESARAEIMTRKRKGGGNVKERRGENERRGRSEKKEGKGKKRRIEGGTGEEGEKRPRQNGVCGTPSWREGARSENARAPHFIAAASSLFIADTTLRAYIPLYSPRDSALRALAKGEFRARSERKRSREERRERRGTTGS